MQMGEDAQPFIPSSASGRERMPLAQYDAMIGRMIREGNTPEQITKAAADAGYTIKDATALSKAVGGGAFRLETDEGQEQPLARALSLGVGGLLKAWPTYQGSLPIPSTPR